MDFNDSLTQIIAIDLKTFKPELIDISKQVIKNASINDVKSNSFIIDNKIILLALTEKTLNLSIKDFKNNLIKEFIIQDNENFSIKNSGFVRQNLRGSERELTSTEQFLRKIVRSNIGVSAYKLNGNYMITLGCVSPEIASGGGMGFGMPMGIPMGMPMTGAMNFMQPINYFGLGFYNYQNRRTISTNCLLNDKFTHVNSKIELLAFDKIEEFKESNTDIQSQTIFKIRNDYYLGYYDFNTTKYNFLIFSE